MSVKLLTEHHLVFLSLKEDCTGSYESTLAKMPHSWKSHVAAHMLFYLIIFYPKQLHVVTLIGISFVTEMLKQQGAKLVCMSSKLTPPRDVV